jgi:hypothetical protein
MIRRIGYVSHPVPGLSLAEIPRIVATCRARNDAEGVRGILIFTGLDFAQLVEGPPGSVADLWARIRADNRHHDVVTMFDERALSTWFSDWRVGFPSDPATIGQIAAWRQRPAATWHDAARAEVKTLLSAIDAL